MSAYILFTPVAATESTKSLMCFVGMSRDGDCFTHVTHRYTIRAALSAFSLLALVATRHGRVSRLQATPPDASRRHAMPFVAAPALRISRRLTSAHEGHLPKLDDVYFRHRGDGDAVGRRPSSRN